MRTVAEINVDPDNAVVHEQGWQSWSPSTEYRLGEGPHRPRGANRRIGAWRAESDPGPGVYCGEGLLAVDPGDGGPVTVVAAAAPTENVPSVHATAVSTVAGSTLVISANGEVVVRTDGGGGGIHGALARWADGVVAGLPSPRPAPTIWCSWYQYFTAVTEADIDANLVALDALDLPVDVVQVDDGYQAGIGDWLRPSGRFADTEGLFRRITDRGRRGGIWTAPFLVGARSALAREHPDWLVLGADGLPVGAGHNWDQDLFALDTTHPAAIDYLRTVFTTFAGWGVDFYKIDFCYAGALPGRRHEDVPPIEAYRRGLRLIRGAIGDRAYLLGCGAPQLPSIGLVDAMRVSPDIAVDYRPADGDVSLPCQLGATLNGVSRAFAHGRLWVNDPDCVLARPEMRRREEWARHVSRFGGLRGSSDGLDRLDDWGLATTRRLLTEPVPARFVVS